MRVIFFIVFAGLFFFSCTNEKFENTESGIEYKFIVHNEDSSKVYNGQILVLKLRYTTGHDSLLFDSREISGEYRKKIKPSLYEGSIDEAISMMHIGDSAIFITDAEQFFLIDQKRKVMPKWVKTGSKIKFYVKIVSLFDYDKFKIEQEKFEIKNQKHEEELLKDYLYRANIKVEPTMSGLYYVPEKEGTGATPQKGEKIIVHYSGYFINGQIFDSSIKRGSAFEFTYGIGDVIQGWEEGLALMKEGGKAKFVVPSHLAYGKEGGGPIPPNSTLIFDIELIRIVK